MGTGAADSPAIPLNRRRLFIAFRTKPIRRKQCTGLSPSVGGKPPCLTQFADFVLRGAEKREVSQNCRSSIWALALPEIRETKLTRFPRARIRVSSRAARVDFSLGNNGFRLRSAARGNFGLVYSCPLPGPKNLWLANGKTEDLRKKVCALRRAPPGCASKACKKTYEASPVPPNLQLEAKQQKGWRNEESTAVRPSASADAKGGIHGRFLEKAPTELLPPEKRRNRVPKVGLIREAFEIENASEGRVGTERAIKSRVKHARNNLGSSFVGRRGLGGLASPPGPFEETRPAENYFELIESHKTTHHLFSTHLPLPSWGKLQWLTA